jgi:hypothetical protein
LKGKERRLTNKQRDTSRCFRRRFNVLHFQAGSLWPSSAETPRFLRNFCDLLLTHAGTPRKVVIGKLYCYLNYEKRVLRKLQTIWADRSRNTRNSVDLTTGCELNGREIRIRFLTRATDSSRLHSFQTGSEAHATSYPMGTRELFRG